MATPGPSRSIDRPKAQRKAMRSLLIPLAVLAVLSASVESATGENGSSASAVRHKYKLYHSVGRAAGGAFAERGDIEIVGSDGGAAGPTTSLTASVVNSADCIVPSAVNDMVAAGALYTVRVVDESTGRSATASVPGCDLRRSNFREEIGLTLTETGSLVSVSYTPLVSPLAPSCRSLEPLPDDAPDAPLEFKTSVTYETAKAAMTVPPVLPKTKPPPGLKFYPRTRGDGPAAATGPGGDAGAGGGGGGSGGGGNPFEDEERAQNQQSGSFLRKYWYIILPVAIMGLTGGGEEPPPGGEQQAGGQQRQGGGAGGGSGPALAGAGAGAAAAAAGGGAPQRQRRGKRD